jgi:hypothetical protein
MDMSAEAPDWLPSAHAGSGTAWQPASVPGHAWMISRDGWALMAHGVVFLTYNQPGGPRAAGKAESVNWLMFMEPHKLGKATLLFREMFSAESLTNEPGVVPRVPAGTAEFRGASLLMDGGLPMRETAHPSQDLVLRSSGLLLKATLA